MAKWTLRDYILALREKIDEVGSNDYFTDGELTRYINAAINDLANELQIEDMKTMTLEEISSIDYKEIFVSDAEKTKPIKDRNHNFFKLKTIFLDNKVVPIGQMEDKAKNVDVTYIWGNKLQFTKPKTGKIEVFYYRAPLTLTNITDTTDIDEVYQHIPLIYAFAQCRRKDENENDYASAMNEYIQAKGEMAYEIGNRNHDGYGFIQINEYGGDM